MRKIVVKVDKQKAECLERLNYELNFTKDIIQRLIEGHPNDPAIIEGGTFKAYQKQGAELQAEYNLVASEIEKECLPEAIRSHKYNWTIPNDSDEMTINILCNCHIEGIEDEKI